MTITSDIRKAGPFPGNGVTTGFPFYFKVFKKEDVLVTFTDSNGTDSVLVLDSDYSVQLNLDQDNNPGGTITYPRTGSLLPLLADSQKLTLTGDLPYTQPTDIPNLSPFFPQVVEDAFDRSEIQIQQLVETLTRTIKVGVSDTPLAALPGPLARQNSAIGFDAIGGLTLLPIPTSIGAGDRVPFDFASGVDFMPGDISIVLPRAPGSQGNVDLHFDGAGQDFTQWSVAGNVVTFASPIPDFVTRIWGYVGTTLSTQVAPDGSVTVPKLAADVLTYISTPSVRTFGGVGDGVANARTALQTDVPAMEIPAGVYRVGTDTTVTAELFFTGGRIRVPTGVTLTMQRMPRAGSDVIFEGGGKVVLQSGVIDVSWFDGPDASEKWTFTARQLTNSNALSKMVAFPTPKPTDAWAALSDLGQWGYGWGCDSPIDVTQLAGETQFITPAPFVARKPMPALWRMGVGAAKVDGWHFPMKLLLDGNSKSVNGMEIQGASTFSIDFIEAQWCASGLVIRPNGAKQVSGFTIGQVMVGGNTGTGIVVDGSANAATSITDGCIMFPNGVGAKIAGVNSFVEISGTVQNLYIPLASTRAVNPGLFDYALAAITIVERNGFAPSRGVRIGYVLTDSSTGSTAKAVHIAGSASVKVSGVSIGGAIASVAPAVSIDNCDWVKIRDVDSVVTVSIGAGANHTRLYGVNRANVTDNGTDTLIDGHNYGPIRSIAAPGSGVAWVNTNSYPVLFQYQGATTVTSVVVNRNGTSVTVAGSGVLAGAFPVGPGDSITVIYTGALAFNIIPM